MINGCGFFVDGKRRACVVGESGRGKFFWVWVMERLSRALSKVL